jgi:hypothetical protein
MVYGEHIIFGLSSAWCHLQIYKANMKNPDIHQWSWICLNNYHRCQVTGKNAHVSFQFVNRDDSDICFHTCYHFTSFLDFTVQLKKKPSFGGMLWHNLFKFHL